MVSTWTKAIGIGGVAMPHIHWTITALDLRAVIDIDVTISIAAKTKTIILALHPRLTDMHEDKIADGPCKHNRTLLTRDSTAGRDCLVMRISG